MPRQRARRAEPAPGIDSLILRGYPLAQDVLHSNAQDNYDVYGFYGVSVFRADTAEEVDTVCATKLRALALAPGLNQRIDWPGFETVAEQPPQPTNSARPHYDVVRGPDAISASTGLVSRRLPGQPPQPTNSARPHYREGEGR